MTPRASRTPSRARPRGRASSARARLRARGAFVRFTADAEATSAATRRDASGRTSATVPTMVNARDVCVIARANSLADAPDCAASVTKLNTRPSRASELGGERRTCQTQRARAIFSRERIRRREYIVDAHVVPSLKQTRVRRADASRRAAPATAAISALACTHARYSLAAPGSNATDANADSHRSKY